ncbi:polyketide synthase [Burkholderia lata]|uniref:Polyketide synthase n=1 Tax=Burkholderia lata (strain ATCC 17760 / DSM 23089 / LMG 22485 / NCIMB 9086 / R18194 / 383) TaxID=482957 RepID=A0A6P3BSJ4_BURL3|nr:type I polyketide synthase [Burkholderia lata]VWD61764.1 polyketide synthase [Burkholderia lata]
MNESNRAPAAPLTPVKQALLKIDALQRELAEARGAVNEPIAIVGMGCRLPGGADSADALWSMLADGTDAVGPVPADRWTDAIYDPRPGRRDTSYSRHGGFIDDVDRFDAAFFGVSEREAPHIDPQQRLLLECTWHALEDAGFSRETIASYRTGVFVGSSVDDYARVSEGVSGDALSFAQTSLGTARPFAAGRISYLFGFHGPALHLDTACSSSLVAMHLACHSLRTRESDVAFAGGVNLMLSPEMTIALSELQALSPSGRCRTFDAAADGYVRGEGCGVVALMRLSDARAQGRSIRAVIRGSAVNHDGRSNGMTAPNGRAQRDVIREALERAGVSPADVDYVEAHGTGTPLGDPIELRALEDVYCRDTNRTRDLYVGSIKTNIGHLESAAAVAGLMKVICALQKGELPRHLHFDTPTAHIDWRTNGIRVATEHAAWPSSRPGRRVAAISSFGMSGTNAHLIVEAWQDTHAPEPDAGVSPAGYARHDIWPLSAHTVPMLKQVIEDCAAHLHADASVAPDAVASALRLTRDSHRHRVAIVADSRETLLDALSDAQRAMTARRTPPAGRDRLAFLFTGQGAQRAGMARQLYRDFAPFRDVFDACDGYIEAQGELSLVDVLWGDHQDRIHETRHTQPAMFALEVALARLWMHWGVVPDVVMGHSIGEYAAACIAGVFSIEDGCRLVTARGRLMDTLTGPGRALAVFANVRHVADALRDYPGRAAIAADNAPESVLVSGDPDAIESIEQLFAAQGIATKALAASRAFHSPLMEPMLAEFGAVAATVQYRAPAMPIVSNVTGRFEAERLCDPAYWVEHVRATVAFRAGVGALLDDKVTTVIEIGPGRTLSGLVTACMEERPDRDDVIALPSMNSDGRETEQLLHALAHVYMGGRRVDWHAYERSRAAAPVRQTSSRGTLPSYPLEAHRYWVGPREPAQRASALTSASDARRTADQGVLGRLLAIPASDHRRYESQVSDRYLPFLGGHVLHGQLVFPAAGFVEAMLDAASRRYGAGTESGSDRWAVAHAVSLDNALTLEPGKAVTLGTVVHAADAALPHDEDARIDIHACHDTAAPAPEWTLQCTSRIGATHGIPDVPALDEWRAQCGDALSVDAFYERLQATGLEYRGAFRSIRALSRGGDVALARIEMEPDWAGDPVRFVHPALLDNAFQAVAGALWDAELNTAFVPIGIERIACTPMPGVRTVWCAARARVKRSLATADLWLYDDAGRCLAVVAELRLLAVDPRRFQRAAERVELNRLVWRPLVAAHEATGVRTNFVLAGNDSELDTTLSQACEAVGHACVSAKLPADDMFDGDAGAERIRTALGDVLAHPDARRTVLLYVWPSTGDATSEGELAAAGAAYRRFANIWREVQRTHWPAGAPAVCVVTQAAQHVPGMDVRVSPFQAAAWGVARSLMHESGEIPVLAVDIPVSDATSCASALAALASAATIGETQFVSCGDVVYVPRLVERESGAAQPLAHGAYLVTGGRGAIGTRVIERLIRSGVPKIVSASRQVPADSERARLASIADAHGAIVEFVAADVAAAADVDALVDALEADSAYPLVGVLHAAGTLDDGLLPTQPMTDVMKVLAPKVAGTLNLHRATAHLSLRHFVSFSSIVACIGSPGQCAYAAANAYVDALMALRNQHGLPGHTMNWGLWGGSGMVDQLDARQLRRIASFGLKPIEPDIALGLFDALVAAPDGQTQIWSVDVDTLIRRSPSRAMGALLSELAPPPTPANRPAGAAAGLRERMAGLSDDARMQLLRRHMTDAIAATLHTSVERIAQDVPLIELGLDSLMAAEFRNALRSDLGVEVPFGRLLEGATIDDVVRTIVATLDRGESRAPGGTPPSRALERIDVVSGEATFGVEMEGGEL